MTDTGPAPALSYSDELRRMAEIDRQSEIAVVKSLMSAPSGRRYLWNLMSFCTVFSCLGAREYGSMAFDEGMRNVGLKLLSSIQLHAPEAYESMVRESASISAHLRAVKAAEDASQQSEFDL